MPPNLFKVSANTPQARQSQTCLSFAERSKCSSEINREKNKTNSFVLYSEMPPNLSKVSANTPQARQSQTCLSFAERSKCSSEINRGKNKTNSCVFLSRCCLTYLKYKFLRRVIAWKATPEKPGTWKRSGHMPGKERKEGRCLEGTTYKYFRRYCLPGRQLSLFVSGHIHSLRSCMYPISEVLPSRQIITT